MSDEGADPSPASPPPPKRRRVKAEAPPSAVPEDDKSKKEKKFFAGLFEKLSDEKSARVAGLYIDMFLRFLMALAFFWLTRGWLYGVLELLEKHRSYAVGRSRDTETP